MLASTNTLLRPAGPARVRAVPVFKQACHAPPRRVVLPVVCSTTAVEGDVQPVQTVPSPVKLGYARLRFQRGSVNKVRRVLNTIRGESYEKALLIMENMPHRACEHICKCLMSAAANAKHNQGALKSSLVVTECYADGGPPLKRIQPRAKGRAYQILKRTFHLYIKLEERV